MAAILTVMFLRTAVTLGARKGNLMHTCLRSVRALPRGLWLSPSRQCQGDLLRS
jgi:hypothetical protein